MKHYSNFIFDLDGTLVDSVDDISDCLKKAIFSEMGVEIEEFKCQISGPPLTQIIDSVLPEISDSGKIRIKKSFRLIYDNYNYPKTFLYDGATEVLNTLQKSGRRIFLATNKPIFPTKKILGKLEFDVFDDISTIDTVDKENVTKSDMLEKLITDWKLDLDETIMVGDSSFDIIAANNNSIDSIAILNDNFNLEFAINSGAKYHLNSVKEILLYI